MPVVDRAPLKYLKIDIICRSFGSGNSGNENFCLLGYNAMYSAASQLKFRRNITLPPSGNKIKLSKEST
jgi:hypothetical protein